MNPGCWVHAGMSGLVVGVLAHEALARVPAGVDRDAVAALIGAAEDGLVRGALAQAERTKP